MPFDTNRPGKNRTVKHRAFYHAGTGILSPTGLSANGPPRARTRCHLWRSGGLILAGALTLNLGTPSSPAAHDLSHLDAPVPRAAASGLPLWDNLGSFHRKVTTASETAQQYFDQGLTLLYGFNHGASVRFFRESLRHDPTCAMAHWGLAMALGPNINNPRPGPAMEQAARQALHGALQLAGKAAPVERGLIEAATVRFGLGAREAGESGPGATGFDETNSGGTGSGEPFPEKARSQRGRDYAAAMRQLHDRFPQDADVSVLYAAALMNTMPWDYWDENGRPRPGTRRLVSVLQAAAARHPENPGAHHYLIHAVEASPHPEWGEASADKLRGLVPGAGHLVHMPGHIYIRVGRYADAAAANVGAIAADEVYLARRRDSPNEAGTDSFPEEDLYALTYYPHNVHFLWAVRTQQGRLKDSLTAARKAASIVPESRLREPGSGFLHLLKAVPLFTLVRFGQWREALKVRSPAGDQPFGRGIWHYARGLAHLRLGDPAAAAEELGELKSLASDAVLGRLRVWDMNSLAQLLTLAREVLTGELAANRGDFAAAERHLQKAVSIEDGLRYTEPPDWPVPVRQNLGAVYLEAGRAAAAARVFQEDLERHRENGWSLFGWMQSLAAQGKMDEAAGIRARFKKAWFQADFVLTTPRY